MSLDDYHGRLPARGVFAFRVVSLHFFSICLACPHSGKSDAKGGQHDINEHKLVQDDHADTTIDADKLRNGEHGRDDEVSERDTEKRAHALGYCRCP